MRQNPYSNHPDDQWVDVTAYGDAEPTFLLARSGWDLEIGRAKSLYVAGRISVEELEYRVGVALRTKATPDAVR